MTKPRSGEKVEEKEKALQMIMSGEREIVNIMADTGIGATTVKNVWAMGRAKGLISKKDRLKGTGLKRVIKEKTAGETVKRLSGRPFVTQTVDPVAKDEHKGEETPKIVDNPEKSAEKWSGHGIPQDISEISTSLDSIKLELRNTMGEMNARLMRVEQSSSNEDKVGKDQKKKESALVDLNHSGRQSGQTVVEESEEGDEGDDNEVPAGHTRVKLPSDDGREYFAHLPDPTVRALQNSLQNLRGFKEDKDIGVGDPFQKIVTIEGTGTRMVIEISPMSESIFDSFRKKYPNGIETQDMTGFANLCIKFFFFANGHLLPEHTD